MVERLAALTKAGKMACSKPGSIPPAVPLPSLLQPTFLSLITLLSIKEVRNSPRKWIIIFKISVNCGNALRNCPPLSNTVIMAHAIGPRGISVSPWPRPLPFLVRHLHAAACRESALETGSKYPCQGGDHKHNMHKHAFNFDALPLTGH